MQADELLTKGIGEIQSSFGMTRTDWQILNSINEKGFIEKSDFTNLMSPFAGPKSTDDILRKFKGDRYLHLFTSF
jgi:hypothetical protein